MDAERRSELEAEYDSLVLGTNDMWEAFHGADYLVDHGADMDFIVANVLLTGAVVA